MALIYSNEYPVQAGGDQGCLCRTCGKHPADYIDQCEECRKTSTRDQDMAFFAPHGEYARRQAEHAAALKANLEATKNKLLTMDLNKDR